MAQTKEEAARPGEVLVLAPGEGKNYWQPVPANGHVSVRVAPKLVPMEHPFGFGTQTVPPGCFVREHAHDRNEELVHFVSGTGKAVIDGIEHRVEPGSTIFLGKNRRHMFVNDGDTDLHWVWLIVPNGLEDFFEAIGRKKAPSEAAPAPFPRPADVLEIERRTVFAAPVSNERRP